jgi:hypothetical protein
MDGGDETLMEQHSFWKPKFIQTAFAQLAATVALFTGHLDQGGWVTVTVLIVGQFTAGSVLENKFLKPAPSAS